QVPPKVEYSLTELGVELSTALSGLADWGQRHMSGIEERRLGIAPAPTR
ncbi:MAG: helix-turn-helix transcriptional regulator, partial [Streptomycetaceae bacterium]|nr:helix-turn-helix transcriptional regulator [Streptomycetaceae bacterium]